MDREKWRMVMYRRFQRSNGTCVRCTETRPRSRQARRYIRAAMAQRRYTRALATFCALPHPPAHRVLLGRLAAIGRAVGVSGRCWSVLG